MKNSNYHTLDIKHCCEKKLKIEFRSGKEFNGWFIYNQLKVVRITIPKGKKPIPPKTYKSMACQLKLTIEQFDELLICTMNYENYTNIIANILDCNR